MIPPDDLYDAGDRAWDLAAHLISYLQKRNADSTEGVTALAIALCSSCKAFEVNKKDFLAQMSSTWDDLSSRLNEDSRN